MRFVSKFKPKSKLEAILSLAVVLAVLIGSWQILALRGENDRLTSRLQAAHGEIQRLESEVVKANDIIALDRVEIRRLEGEVRKGNDIIAEANADIHRLQSDLSRSNAETQRLRGELGEANSLIRQQNAALQEAQESSGGAGLATLISLGCLFLGLPC